MKRTYQAGGLQFTESQLITIEAALAAMIQRNADADEMIPGGLLRPHGYKWEQDAIRRLHSTIQSEMARVSERQNERQRQCAKCPHAAEEHRFGAWGNYRTGCFEKGCDCIQFIGVGE